MNKRMMILLAAALVASLLSGCRRSAGETTGESLSPTETPTSAPTTAPTAASTQTETQPTGTADTASARILNKIWSEFADTERFAAYGGTIAHAVDDGPGDLDVTDTEELTNHYLLPEELLTQVEEGASLVHLMNSNIFTCAAFRLKDGSDLPAAAKALRDNLQRTHWICGQPDRLLIARVEGQLLMAFGSGGNMEAFRTHLGTAFPGGEVLYDEAVTA